MQIQTLVLPNPGLTKLYLPNNILFKVIEILPDASCVTSIIQRFGNFVNSYNVGDTIYGGSETEFTTTAACTIAFDGIGQFAVVTAIADIPYDAAAILDTGSAAPRIVRRRANGSYWYGTPFSSTP